MELAVPTRPWTSLNPNHLASFRFRELNSLLAVLEKRGFHMVDQRTMTEMKTWEGEGSYDHKDEIFEALILLQKRIPSKHPTYWSWCPCD
jgi:hypothetical protein